jgi:hypothetical protein
MLERAKSVHASDRAATAISGNESWVEVVDRTLTRVRNMISISANDAEQLNASEPLCFTQIVRNSEWVSEGRPNSVQVWSMFVPNDFSRCCPCITAVINHLARKTMLPILPFTCTPTTLPLHFKVETFAHFICRHAQNLLWGGGGGRTEITTNISCYLILPAALGPGVYSASNRNEYQKQKL